MLRLASLLALLATVHGCTNGKYSCQGKNIAVCSNGNQVPMPCAPGTACKMYGSTPVCATDGAGGGSSSGGKPSGGKPSGGSKPEPTDPPAPATGGGGGSGDKLVSFEEFKAGVTSCGYPAPSQAKYNNAVGQAKKDGDISSKREFAMFLTEILWESDGLRATSEYRCKSNNCAGEYAVPGCDKPGKFYFGRGYIQLTWCYNYKAASADLFGDDRLVRTPEKVASDDSLAWATAFWYWKKNVHNAAGVQQGKFGAATNAINGALECRGGYQHKAKKRWACYQKVYKAFKLPGSPIESGCYN